MDQNKKITTQNLPLQGAGGRLVVLGAGESGAGAAYLAQQQGYEVFVSDLGPIADQYKKQLQDWNVRFEENGHTEEEILKAVEVVKSPGIPEKASIVKKLKGKGMPVYKKADAFGDLYLTYEIELPTNLTAKQRELFEELARS